MLWVLLLLCPFAALHSHALLEKMYCTVKSAGEGALDCMVHGYIQRETIAPLFVVVGRRNAFISYTSFNAMRQFFFFIIF